MVLSSPPSAARETLSRAVVLTAGGPRLAALPRPTAGPGELVLALRCCGFCGTDLWKLDHGGAPLGSVLGHEVVGTLVEAGPGVVGFLPGDRVAVPHHVGCGECDACVRRSEPFCPAFRENQLSPGGFSDLIRVGARAVRLAAYGLPDSLPDEAAVFLEPGACVLRGLRRSGLGETVARLGTGARGASRGETRAMAGSTAAVMGAGSMGLLHLLLLRSLWPALQAVLVDPLPERRERALALGAALAVPPGEPARQAVAGLSADRGADAVFDTVGGPSALAAALELTRPGGTVVLFAHAAPGAVAELDLNPFWKAERRVVGTYSSGLADQREVYRLLATDRLDPSPLVTHRFPLSRFDEAVALARDRRALKVLLTPEGDV